MSQSPSRVEGTRLRAGTTHSRITEPDCADFIAGDGADSNLRSAQEEARLLLRGYAHEPHFFLSLSLTAPADRPQLVIGEPRCTPAQPASPGRSSFTARRGEAHPRDRQESIDRWVGDERFHANFVARARAKSRFPRPLKGFSDCIAAPRWVDSRRLTVARSAPTSSPSNPTTPTAISTRSRPGDSHDSHPLVPILPRAAIHAP